MPPGSKICGPGDTALLMAVTKFALHMVNLNIHFPVLSVFFAIGGSTGIHSPVRLRTSGPEPPYKARQVGAGGGKVASSSW